MGPTSLPRCPRSPLGGCSAEERVSPLPCSPCGGCRWTGRTRKDKVTLEDGSAPFPHSAAACLVLPSCPVSSPLRARGWQRPCHPNPIHPWETTGIFMSVPWLMGREGAQASPCPASSSSSTLHQQPKNTSAAARVHCALHPLRLPAEGTRNSPSLHVPPQGKCPRQGVLGLLFAEGCPCHHAWYPSSSGSCGCSAPIRMCRPPWVSAYRVSGWGWVTGGSGDKVRGCCKPSTCICLHQCLSRPSSLMLLHLLRNP